MIYYIQRIKGEARTFIKECAGFSIALEFAKKKAKKGGIYRVCRYADDNGYIIEYHGVNEKKGGK